MITACPFLLALSLVASLHANNKVNWQLQMAEFEPHLTCYHTKLHCVNNTTIRICGSLADCLASYGPCQTVFIHITDTPQSTVTECIALYTLVCHVEISPRDMWRYFLVLRQYEQDQANGLAGAPSSVVKHWAQLGLKTAHYYNEHGAMRGYRAGDQVEFTLEQYMAWNDLSHLVSCCLCNEWN